MLDTPYVNEINIDTCYAQVCRESCVPAVPWECTFPSQMQLGAAGQLLSRQRSIPADAGWENFELMHNCGLQRWNTIYMLTYISQNSHQKCRTLIKTDKRRGATALQHGMIISGVCLLSSLVCWWTCGWTWQQREGEEGGDLFDDVPDTQTKWVWQKAVWHILFVLQSVGRQIWVWVPTDWHLQSQFGAAK